jgi:CBS domain-containing protein
MKTSRIVASEIMTHSLATTTPEQHVLDAIDELIRHRVSGLPVLNQHHDFVGQFSERTGIAALDLAKPHWNSTSSMNLLIAADIMKKPELVLFADDDVFASMNRLVQSSVSGATVLDNNHNVLGVFSEQSAMKVFIGLCWEQLPSSKVRAWLDGDLSRQIPEATPLADILQIFQDTSFRRLLVVREGKLVGEVTRRDALEAAVESSRTPLMASRKTGGGDQLGMKTDVDVWMHREVPTITENVDVLTIAQMFIHSSARQLPVLESMRLRGQVSRSDLLRAVLRYLPEPRRSGTGAQPLYLSTVRTRQTVAALG